MILASHAIIGAAIARLVPDNLYLGFLLGIVSHFIGDAIPHWHYDFHSAVRDKKQQLVGMRWNMDWASMSSHI